MSPKGLFEFDDESQSIKYAEEFAIPKCKELSDLGAWGHNQPIILKSGRCTHYIPKGLEDDKREELEA